MHFPSSSQRQIIAASVCALLLLAVVSINTWHVAAEDAAEIPPAIAKRAATPDEAVVFAALDLTLPELAPVAAAVREGDYEAASRAWAVYLRGRTNIVWGGKEAAAAPLPSFNLEVANNAAIGKVRGGLVPITYAFPDGSINWSFNATKAVPGAVLNHEWQWQLNRMAFWLDMARAYTAKRDERFPQAFARQLNSWVRQCPVPSSVQNIVGSPWRTIEAGIRMGQNWPEAFFRFLPSPSLSDADIMAFTRSVADHGAYLRKYQTNVNWVLMEMNGLATAGCYFPEFRDAADWRAFAFERLSAEAKRQFLPDGAQYELSTGYHNDVVIPNFLSTRNVALWTGRSGEIPPDFTALLQKAFDWSMYLSTPDGYRPLVNDSWPGRIDYYMKQAILLYPSRDDFRWFATLSKEGRAPEKTSVFLDWSGMAVMRSGWGKEDNYMMFRVGPLGYGGLMGRGHAHQARLSVVMWPYGRELLFNGGGSSYTWDKWRIWSRSSLSHNCVTVDGLGQDCGKTSAGAGQEHSPDRVSQQPIEAAWQSTPEYDFACAIYDQEWGTSEYGVPGLYDHELGPQKRLIASHRRSVLFLKPDLYVIADTLSPLDSADEKDHAYQARWHLLTTRTEIAPGTSTVTTLDDGKPNLAIVPLLTSGLNITSASARETPELLGWNCRKDMDPQNVPATTVLQSRSGKGVQRFLTLFIPLRAGEKNPVASVEPVEPETSASTEQKGALVRLNDGRTLRITASEAGRIDVSETAADGKPGRQVAASPIVTVQKSP